MDVKLVGTTPDGKTVGVMDVSAVAKKHEGCNGSYLYVNEIPIQFTPQLSETEREYYNDFCKQYRMEHKESAHWDYFTYAFVTKTDVQWTKFIQWSRQHGRFAIRKTDSTLQRKQIINKALFMGRGMLTHVYVAAAAAGKQALVSQLVQNETPITETALTVGTKILSGK